MRDCFILRNDGMFNADYKSLDSRHSNCKFEWTEYGRKGNFFSLSQFIIKKNYTFVKKKI